MTVSLRLRLLLSLLAVLLLMAAPAFYGATRVAALRDIVLELRGQAAQSALAVGRLEAALAQVDRYQRAYVATADTALAARMHTALREGIGQIALLRAAGYGDLVDAAGLRLEEVRDAAAQLETHMAAGRLEAATAYLVADATPRVERTRAAVPALAAAIDAKTSARVPIAQRSAITAGTATTVATFVALVLAGALALTVARVLTRPLDRLRFAMARVADGTFETPPDLPYERADEVGDLSRSFRTMTLRLAETDRLKAEFVGSASHDLKTPIAVITGYTELMQDELDAPQHARHREMLRAIAEQARTMQRRVDQLLEISRVESGRLRLGLEEINVRHFAGELHRAFAATARARDIQLELCIHERTPRVITGDPDVLRTDVLGNLLDNALKFTPARGLVRVSIRPDGEGLGLEVADTGRGIPAERLEHIFDRYYQGRAAGRGAGLGLAIARAGVEAHGGHIAVHSRVERGTRVRITLPVHVPASAEPPRPVAAG